jgi:biotin synthase
MSTTADQVSAEAPASRFSPLRHDWRLEEVEALFDLPFMELMFRAQQVHRAHHAANRVQMSTLLSIKTGGCPEDCGYCPQSIHYDTGVAREDMLPLEQVVEAARRAQAAGATRFCMGAAFRSPKKKDIERIATMIREVGALGLETCATLGMLTPQQAHELKDAGLDYYNHNVDSSEEFYKQIISTRTYQHRLDTLEAVRNANLKVCSGGIVGMGETRTDRAGMLVTLANLPEHPQSVPINQLVQVQGTPLEDTAASGKGVDGFEFVRTIAVARILMPAAQVRLSAGREAMNDELQALAFLAGANSIFYGEKLLATSCPSLARADTSSSVRRPNTPGESWLPAPVNGAAGSSRKASSRRLSIIDAIDSSSCSRYSASVTGA